MSVPVLTDKVFILSCVIFAGIICQWIAWRVKLPAILFLLFTGIIVGPVAGLLDSDALFGDLLFPFISLSVAVILFEGSLTLRFHQIIGLRKVVQNLISFGVLVTWLITTIVTRFALDFSWQLSFLFGAVTVVTGPTVIVPMLRTVRPSAAVANILRWEGIVIDPVGATLAVLVYEFIISGSSGNALGQTLFSFSKLVGIGLLLGALSGYLYGLLLRRHLIPEFLHNVTTLALVFIVFAVSNTLQHESGLLTVTVMGIWLSNMKDVPVDDILDFKESLSVLLITVLFIILAARMNLDMFVALGWRALFVFLAIQFLARPISVMISSLGSKLTWPERHILAWIAPRGIIAAAISALFAIKLEQKGFTDAELLVPLTFMVIIGTVVLQSCTAGLIAKRLGIAEPDPKGVLIIGANMVAFAIAKSLKQEGFKCLLVDTSWDKISKARMEGLDTYYGEPVSEHADRHLDLIGIGKMLALSPRGALNALSCMHYRMEFGYNAVYTLQVASELELSEVRKSTSQSCKNPLFGKNITFSKLSMNLTKGWKIHNTRLTDQFTYEKLMNNYDSRFIPLFAVKPNGNLEIFTADHKIKPQAGWIVIAMVPGDTSVS
ncbi:MAG: sodium:proton antiporter [Pseudomonadota bacterium]